MGLATGIGTSGTTLTAYWPREFPLPVCGILLYPLPLNPRDVLGVDPTEIYVSDSRHGGYTYHTSLECPNLPTVYNTLTPDDPEFEDAIKRDECQWCRYDTLGALDDGNGAE